MANQTTILLIEDELSMARAYQAYLAKEPYLVEHVSDGAQAMAALDERIPNIVLLDLMLPDISGLEILQQIQARALPCEVIVVTGDGSISTAVESMRLGAKDFLVKPFSKDRLLTTLRNAVEHHELTEIVQTYREEIDRKEYSGFIGGSLEMQKVYRIIDSAATTKATVFVTGESGTGKEVCAEAIHRRSNRAGKPFIAVNCGAIPKDLMESELFGHVKGAFSGAVKDREGAARLAHGGTLFLDEICEMDISLQPKLLRFLQTGTFQRVGSSVAEPVDVRIICATNRNPSVEVNEGRFREDLFYRLHVLPVHLPPLRERADDIAAIARHFLCTYAAEEGKQFDRFAPEVEDVLCEYAWPGNVRQLQNVVRNIIVFNQGETVTPAMLPAPLDQQPVMLDKPARATSADPVASTPVSSSQILPLADMEREAIEQAIRICDGNIPTAAHHLGISAATIYRKRASWQAMQIDTDGDQHV